MWPKWYKPVYSFNWRQTLEQVAAIYKVTPEDILGTSRKEYLTDARWVFMKALRAKGRLSFPVIGKIVNRDHTTVLHACREFQHRAKFKAHMSHALQKVMK